MYRAHQARGGEEVEEGLHLLPGPEQLPPLPPVLLVQASPGLPLHPLLVGGGLLPAHLLQAPPLLLGEERVGRVLRARRGRRVRSTNLHRAPLPLHPRCLPPAVRRVGLQVHLRGTGTDGTGRLTSSSFVLTSSSSCPLLSRAASPILLILPSSSASCASSRLFSASMASCRGASWATSACRCLPCLTT